MKTKNIAEAMIVAEADKVFEGLTSGQAMEILGGNPSVLNYIARKYNKKDDSLVLINRNAHLYEIIIHKCSARLG